MYGDQSGDFEFGYQGYKGETKPAKTGNMEIGNFISRQRI